MGINGVLGKIMVSTKMKKKKGGGHYDVSAEKEETRKGYVVAL